jgi:hypothetical protein
VVVEVEGTGDGFSVACKDGSANRKNEIIRGTETG